MIIWQVTTHWSTTELCAHTVTLSFFSCNANGCICSFHAALTNFLSCVFFNLMDIVYLWETMFNVTTIWTLGNSQSLQKGGLVCEALMVWQGDTKLSGSDCECTSESVRRGQQDWARSCRCKGTGLFGTRPNKKCNENNHNSNWNHDSSQDLPK